VIGNHHNVSFVEQFAILQMLKKFGEPCVELLQNKLCVFSGSPLFMLGNVRAVQTDQRKSGQKTKRLPEQSFNPIHRAGVEHLITSCDKGRPHCGDGQNGAGRPCPSRYFGIDACAAVAMQFVKQRDWMVNSINFRIEHRIVVPHVAVDPHEIEAEIIDLLPELAIEPLKIGYSGMSGKKSGNKSLISGGRRRWKSRNDVLKMSSAVVKMFF